MPKPKLEKDGTYSIRFCYKDAFGNTQRKFKTGFKKESQAIIWAYNAKKELEGSLGEDMSLFQFCIFLLETKTQLGLAPKTIFSYNENMEIIKKELGNPKMRNITTLHLQAVINHYADRPGRCEHLCSTMSMMFNFAIKQKVISTNPFIGVDKPSFAPAKKKKKKSLNLTQFVEFKEFVKSVDPKFLAPILLMGALGLRPGEAVALLESDFDRENNIVTISKSMITIERVKRNGQTVQQRTTIKAPTKTHATRTLSYQETFWEELHYYKNMNGIKSEYVCCYEDGSQMTSNAVYQALRRLTMRYGKDKITPYSLRHTFGNIHKRLGNDSYTVSKLYGHASERTTKENYYEDDEVLNVRAMGKVFDAVYQGKKQD